MKDYDARAHAAARIQLPHVPAMLLDSLPVDGPRDRLFLAQTGGFIMCMGYGTKLLSETGTTDDGDLYGVFDYDTDEEGVQVYAGNDFGAALEALTA
jgi:hypothetical protein